MNILELQEKVNDFRSSSYPSSATYSDPCTVADIRKVVNNLADLLTAFVDELAEQDNH